MESLFDLTFGTLIHNAISLIADKIDKRILQDDSQFYLMELNSGFWVNLFSIMSFDVQKTLSGTKFRQAVYQFHPSTLFFSHFNNVSTLSLWQITKKQLLE